MMLRHTSHSSLPSSSEAGLSPASDHRGKELLHDKYPKGGHERAIPVMENTSNYASCSMNLLSASRQSTVVTMSENFTPTFVYQRKKQQKDFAAEFPSQESVKENPSGNCLSVISSETHSVADKDHVVSAIEVESEAVRDPVMLPMECTSSALVSKSASVCGCSLGEELGSVEDSKHDMVKDLDVSFVNDSCSSSKSNMDLCTTAALKTEVDDTGECSSSEAFIMDGLHDNMSKKDVYISILKSLGLYKSTTPITTHASPEGPGINTECSCLRLCKVCDMSEITLKMLICDQCEDAFHVSCCKPRIRKIPLDDWFCHSCLKEKQRTLVSTKRGSHNSSGEMGRCRIVVMLEDSEPYTTNVRIGPEFQAEVPDWSGPLVNEVDNFSEPLEMNPPDCSQEVSARNTSRASSISNWLQCQEVIDGVGEGVDGTVCGKWRRAPLFEVQTENWECFRAVLWDPAHADCAVPQEVDTDQVLKDLKYIEMLKPRLDTKKRQLSSGKKIGFQLCC